MSNNKKLTGSLPLLLAVIACCFSGLLLAQETDGLRVGDTLPDVEIQHPVRSHATSLRTGELYKDGLLLLNFWATWCIPCVKEMELLAEQLEVHKGKFRVLGVAYEPASTIANFLKKHPRIADSDIEIITDDEYFSKLFFHQTLPHNVWVNQQGVVQAITGGEAVTAENIAGMLSGETVALNEKREVRFDMFKPLHVPDSLIEFRAIFQKEVPGVYQSGAVMDASSSGKSNAQRFFCFNLLIKDLMWKAHQMPGYNTNDYLMEVHTTDSAKFFWPGEGKSPKTYTGISRSDWGKENHYSYELRSTKRMADSLFFSRVISDLELNLGVHSYRTLRKRQVCYVTYHPEAVQMKPAEADEKFYIGIVDTKLIIRNVSMHQLIDWLARQAFGAEDRPPRKEPYIDRTGIDYPITMTVDLGDNSWNYLSFEHLEKCFVDRLGLRFKVAEGLYPILIIEDW